MIAFVTKISQAAKAINPNFKIIPNNAEDLLVVNANNPSSASNTSYLSAIDGLLVETTFYNPDNSVPAWSTSNQQYIQHAITAGKTVLSIDYPSNATTQAAYIAQAVAAGYVPYAATQSLGATVLQSNNDYWSNPTHALPLGAMTSLLGTSPLTAALLHDTGSSSTDGITSDPTLTGAAPAGAVVTVQEGTVVLGSVTANASGIWTFLPTGLADGAHQLVAS